MFTSSSKISNFFKNKNSLLDSTTQVRSNWIACLQDELSETENQITQNLIKNIKVLVHVKKEQGFYYFLTEYLKRIEQYYYLYVFQNITTAKQLASVLLKEIFNSQDRNPLEKLEKLLREQNHTVIVLENISSLSNSEIEYFSQSLPNTKFIFIDETIESLSSTVSLKVKNYNEQVAQKKGLMILGYDENSELLSKKEFQELVSFTENYSLVLETAFKILLFKKLSIKKFTEILKKIQKFQPEEEKKYLCFFEYIYQDLPKEIKDILLKMVLLPSFGFTINDLMVISQKNSISVEDLKSVIDFADKFFCLQKIYTEKAIIHRFPEFIRNFLEKKLSELEISEKNNIQNLLLVRLESKLLWHTNTLWLTQLEQALLFLQQIKDSADQKQTEFLLQPYIILELLVIMLELGFVNKVKEIIIPFCHRKIAESENNEQRGNWYNLLAFICKETANFSNKNIHLNMSLNAFHKSLKFYDPVKAHKHFCKAFENIGKVHFALGQHEEQDRLLNYKQSIKFLGKAITAYEQEEYSNFKEIVLELNVLIARVYCNIAREEKILENYQKAVKLFADVSYKLNQTNHRKLIKQIISELTIISNSWLTLQEKLSYGLPEEKRKLEFLKKNTLNLYEELKEIVVIDTLKMPNTKITNEN